MILIDCKIKMADEVWGPYALSNAPRKTNPKYMYKMIIFLLAVTI